LSSQVGGCLYKAVKLDATILDCYVGEYQLAPNFILKVSREGERFFVQGTGQRAVENFPETETDFFAKGLDSRITFVKDDKGQITYLIVHQPPGDQTARKIK